MLIEMQKMAEKMPDGPEKKMMLWAALELEDRRLYIEEIKSDDNSRIDEVLSLQAALIQSAYELDSTVALLRSAAFSLSSKNLLDEVEHRKRKFFADDVKNTETKKPRKAKK